LLILFLENTIK